MFWKERVDELIEHIATGSETSEGRLETPFGFFLGCTGGCLLDSRHSHISEHAEQGGFKSGYRWGQCADNQCVFICP